MDLRTPHAPVQSGISGQEVKPRLRILMAAPRGFCAGVRRAIEAVEAALRTHGKPVYVRRPIVHNLAVVRDLEAKGAVFVQELEDVPQGAVVILSAHGVGKHILAQAEQRGHRWFDAVCPLVSKVHREVQRHHEDGRHVILVGHAGHPEILGTLGRIPSGAGTLVSSVADVAALNLPAAARLAYAVQTTYSVDEASDVLAALRNRFEDLQGPQASDICYATTNRQRALKLIVPAVDAVIVAGEVFSSNAARLADVARSIGCENVQLVGDPEDLDWGMLADVRSVGITAAASTPEASVQALVSALSERFSVTVEEASDLPERTTFRPLEIN